jgi:hypothetical protein
MTRTLKLLSILIPRERAAQVGTIIDNTAIAECAILLNNQIGGFTSQTSN